MNNRGTGLGSLGVNALSMDVTALISQAEGRYHNDTSVSSGVFSSGPSKPPVESELLHSVASLVAPPLLTSHDPQRPVKVLLSTNEDMFAQLEKQYSVKEKMIANLDSHKADIARAIGILPGTFIVTEGDSKSNNVKSGSAATVTSSSSRTATGKRSKRVKEVLTGEAALEKVLGFSYETKRGGGQVKSIDLRGVTNVLTISRHASHGLHGSTQSGFAIPYKLAVRKMLNILAGVALHAPTNQSVHADIFSRQNAFLLDELIHMQSIAAKDSFYVEAISSLNRGDDPQAVSVPFNLEVATVASNIVLRLMQRRENKQQLPVWRPRHERRVIHVAASAGLDDEEERIWDELQGGGDVISLRKRSMMETGAARSMMRNMRLSKMVTDEDDNFENSDDSDEAVNKLKRRNISRVEEDSDYDTKLVNKFNKRSRKQSDSEEIDDEDLEMFAGNSRKSRRMASKPGKSSRLSIESIAIDDDGSEVLVQSELNPAMHSEASSEDSTVKERRKLRSSIKWVKEVLSESEQEDNSISPFLISQPQADQFDLEETDEEGEVDNLLATLLVDATEGVEGGTFDPNSFYLPESKDLIQISRNLGPVPLQSTWSLPSHLRSVMQGRNKEEIQRSNENVIRCYPVGRLAEFVRQGLLSWRHLVIHSTRMHEMNVRSVNNELDMKNTLVMQINALIQIIKIIVESQFKENHLSLSSLPWLRDLLELLISLLPCLLLLSTAFTHLSQDHLLLRATFAGRIKDLYTPTSLNSHAPHSIRDLVSKGCLGILLSCHSEKRKFPFEEKYLPQSLIRCWTSLFDLSVLLIGQESGFGEFLSSASPGHDQCDTQGDVAMIGETINETQESDWVFKLKKRKAEFLSRTKDAYSTVVFSPSERLLLLAVAVRLGLPVIPAESSQLRVASLAYVSQSMQGSSARAIAFAIGCRTLEDSIIKTSVADSLCKEVFLNFFLNNLTSNIIPGMGDEEDEDELDFLSVATSLSSAPIRRILVRQILLHALEGFLAANSDIKGAAECLAKCGVDALLTTLTLSGQPLAQQATELLWKLSANS